MSKKKHRSIALETVGAPLIDSHCHLAPSVFGDETGDVVERVFATGLERVVNVGAGHGMDGNLEVLAMYQQTPRLHPTIGVHPHDASILEADPGLADELLALAGRPEVVAYGEIGLDYYYNFSTPDVQREGLRRQLEIARFVGKPLIIHDRDAHEDVLRLLEDGHSWELGVVFHCFSGDWSLAERCLERGAYLGVPGIVTFNKADDLKEVVTKAPMDRLLVETDSPYLAPVPFRGRRNEPAFVQMVAREIARLRNVAVEEVARITSENARRLFALPAD